MATRRNILQSLRHRAGGIGRLLLPALAVTLICPAGAVCADMSAAAPIASQGMAAHEHGVPASDRDVPSSDPNGDYCPHCDAQASAMSAARTACDGLTEDAPPPAKLPYDLQLVAPPSAIAALPVIPHPSPPRTAYSTGSGPPSVPLNLLHCVFLN